jgi:hypothetical protein
VDDERARSLRAIDETLRQQGFVRDWQRPMPTYAGMLDKTGLSVPVSILMISISSSRR